jgi:hypothetical protein
MKEKYVGSAYGLGSWHKTDTFTRTVYDFSGKKTWSEKAIAFLIWSGLLAMATYLVSLFV